ncbi:DUF1190 domain-containing protein [Methylosinus sp. Sm6]|uniref:DUF1190 domain-containing protein n=1 Tax=Methylosinus sp. Sm6 TaxID=2866948 RepID=UPI001C99C805|nr:DUF1190 domain-containing protein [Methylosinus sp. Sm6]MBY6242702.1 DUF1190 domain-containing protein [Methylosinus sp. Sm6]
MRAGRRISPFSGEGKAEGRALQCGLAALLSILCAVAAPAPAAAGGFFLYATPHACASSGIFRRRECEIAFTNAQTDVRARTETFSSRGRCEARYRLCEKPEAEDGGWRAALLGIEIVGGPDHWSAMPVLGAEIPRLFVNRPISRLIEPMTDSWTPILASGRFRVGGPARVTASAEPSAALEGEIDEPRPAMRSTRESESARRERLRSAPFIQ